MQLKPGSIMIWGNKKSCNEVYLILSLTYEHVRLFCIYSPNGNFSGKTQIFTKRFMLDYKKYWFEI
jgi:exonuclease III